MIEWIIFKLMIWILKNMKPRRQISHIQGSEKQEEESVIEFGSLDSEGTWREGTLREAQTWRNISRK